MATYTGVADANGDFTVPFSSNYTGGQKVTVTAEKDGAEKTIELHAPSEAVGGGIIQFTGTLNNFPNNIGGVILSEISGSIGSNSFQPFDNNSIWNKATSLEIKAPISLIGDGAFSNWKNALSLSLPSSLNTINNSGFRSWINATSLLIPNAVTTLGMFAFNDWPKAKSLAISNGLKSIPSNCFSGWSALTAISIPNGVLTIGDNAFSGAIACLSLVIPQSVTAIAATAFNSLLKCETITVNAQNPPSITSTTFSNLKAGCVFKVPAASLAAYQAAPNWSVFSGQMVGV